MADRAQPRLAVMLHVDVVGSTTLVRRDERLAHQRIQAAFRDVGALVERYGGTVNEIRGDALVAEFARASDAVLAALAAQDSNRERVRGLVDGVAPNLRMGIALGEVVIADATVTGAGVVLAQRLEQLAEPGAICVSSAVREAVPDRLPLRFRSLGTHELKGFEEPVQAYAVSTTQGAPVPPPQPSTSPHIAGRRRSWLAAGGVVVLTAAAALAWFGPWPQTQEHAPAEPMAFSLPDKPSIAVLPFENLSADPEQQYFVDGVTEDLITDLSKIAGLFVIARNSSFAYRGRAVDMKQVGRELSVRHLLAGSVRRSGDTVRINARLIDAVTGVQLWSDRYDGELRSVFDLQDNVTSKIVSVLAVQLGGDDRKRVARKETHEVAAYDEFVIGWKHYLRQTPEDAARAIPYFERAVALDPEYGQAYAALAATYWYAAKRYWGDALGYARIHDLEFEAERFLEKAMRHPTPLAHHVASDRLSLRHRHDEAIAEAEKAIALDPNDADGFVALAAALTLAGRPGEALELVERGIRLNPHFPPHYLYELGLARFGLGQVREAAVALERALSLNPHDRFAQRLLLASYGLLGRETDAAGLIEATEGLDQRGRMGTSFDPLTIRASTYWIPFRRGSDVERFTEGLRNAGVPD